MTMSGHSSARSEVTLKNRGDLDLQAELFLQKLASEANEFGLKLEPTWQIDHLCYRASTNEEYGELKDFFQLEGKLLAETPVNGRMIASFQFEGGFKFRSQMIDVIELPAPKEGKHTPSGFEHIEVVIDTAFAKFEAGLPTHLQSRIKRKGLAKAFNPELEIELRDVNIKFHHQTLAEVVHWEIHPRIFTSLEILAGWSELKGRELIVNHENEILIFGPTQNRDKELIQRFAGDFLRRRGSLEIPPTLRFEERTEELELFLKEKRSNALSLHHA